MKVFIAEASTADRTTQAEGTSLAHVRASDVATRARALPDDDDSVSSVPHTMQGRVCINGRFLSQRGSGVQRFALQVLLAADTLLASMDARGEPRRRWVLMIPPGSSAPPLQAVEVRTVGFADGHLWDQLLRVYCSRHDVMVNLANSGPVFRARSICVVHDAAVFRTPENFTRAYRLFHQFLGRALARRSTIGTVSRFSRGELATVLKMEPERIFIIPNSCEHLAEVIPDETIVARLGLVPGRYLLAIGSPVVNKNLAAAIKAYAKLTGSNQQFVIVGAVDTSVFGGGLSVSLPGVVLAGALSDAEIAALLRSATALVFPSLYEGFGIPPLEAMLQRCPVVAARIPPVEEVCGDAVLYFDPRDVDSIAAALQQAIDEPRLLGALVARGVQRAASYSWRHSAQCLIDAVGRIP